MKSASELFDELDPSEVYEWALHPVTKNFFKILNAMREEIKEHWIVGAMTQEDMYREVKQSAFYAGQAALAQYLEEMLEDKIEELRTNDQSDWVSSSN